jgi:hypothetical protein
MPFCAPQRYVGNEANIVRLATLTPSSVLPVEDKVIKVPAVRFGTGDVELTGPYDGAEEATYDVEVVDLTADEQVVTAVVSAGVGSGTLTGIVAQGSPQEYSIELQNDGVPTLAAGVAFEGVRIVARDTGVSGNDLSLVIDQSPLTFTAQPYSLLTALAVGDGGPNNGVSGAAFDWDTKVLSADNIIPLDAHRVAFAGDTSNIYLAYKKYDGTDWTYHFVPAIRRAVPKGTVVNFVTGGREVTVRDLGVTQETITNVVTAYDLLNAIKTTSVLLDVSGVVAYDRSPTGQAAKELLARTDAHVEPSTGTGSAAATGFTDTFANDNAATELVTATCYAVSLNTHPLARLGAERWRLKGSVSGALGDIVTGVPFEDPELKFGLTIPVKLPPGYNSETPVGRFSLTDIRYVSREDAAKPPICMVAMALGPAAVDQTITLTWTQRPSGDCACTNMPVPRLSKRCLGIETETEEGSLAYQADTIAALLDLYEWYAATVEERSRYIGVAGNVYGEEEPALGAPVSASGAAGVSFDPAILDSIKDVIALFEETIAEIDPLDATDPLRIAGFSAWDAAVVKLKYDVDALASDLINITSERYKSLLDVALISAGISPLGKTDASILESGDGCWRDIGGDYWTVVGSDGAYAPAFNNTVYYSSRAAADGKKYYTTKEFAFQINILCPDLLVYDDQIVLTIGGAANPSTYQVGDELVLPIIAEQPLQLAGGQTGDAILDFYVSGSVDGALPPYAYDPDAPAAYYEAGALTFLYTPGGIPNRKGDRWTFATEGGHYRWRKDGGAWVEDSPLPSISSTPIAFDSGLSITWVPGASPSFEVGDMYSFRALQPWAVSNVRTPSLTKWRWDEVDPDRVIDAGAVVSVPGAVIARHTIPEGATITLEGGTSPGVYLWTETLDWNEDVIAAEFAVAQSARYLRLSLTDAEGGGIGWAWAGVLLSTSLSADVDVTDSYNIESSSTGLDEGGKYFARSTSGQVSYSEAALNEADTAGLRALIRWAKTHNDEPIVLIPNIQRPDEAHLVQIAVDRLTWKELSAYNALPNVGRERRYNIDIPLSGVWRA